MALILPDQSFCLRPVVRRGAPGSRIEAVILLDLEQIVRHSVLASGAQRGLDAIKIWSGARQFILEV